jgi:rhamnogalacturonan endolyase
MDGGHEYLTVFNGLTGEAIHTIAYNPNRNATSVLSEAAGTFNWAIGKTDTHGYNRGDRYLAGVGYIDGPDRPASGIFCRGYYSYAFIWAVSFDGQHLIPRWLSEHRNGTSYSVTTYDADGKGTKKNYSNIKPTRGSGSGTMFANGNHNMSMADVDGDGCDEVVWGSAGLDHDGTLLYGTGFGHGDAIHLADHCPDRPGLELFQIHEEGSHYGWDLHDAATGQIIHSANGSGDNGRGIAGQFDANVRGSLFWSSNDGSARSAVTGDVVSSKHGSSNFRIYWDGDLQDELLDGSKIDKWNGDGTSRLATLSGNTCNSTKNTPNLSADILGDWREEVILHNGSNEIYIYSTNTETGYRVPTLMHDHTYRMGICWQNVAYNQPPHLGYYLPDAFMPSIDKNEFTVSMGEAFEFSIQTKYAKSVSIKASFMPDGTKKTLVMPTGMSRSFDSSTKVLTVKGTADQEGDYRIAIGLNALGSGSTPDTLVIHSVNTTGIETVNAKTDNEPSQIYDLQGRKCNEMHSGEIYIIRQNGRTRKVVK